MHLGRDFKCSAFRVTFCDNDNARRLIRCLAQVENVHQVLNGQSRFRCHHCHSTCRNTCIQCNKATVSTHDLNKKQPIVAIGRVADFVDRLYNCVRRRVKADGEIRTGQIIVNGSRQADDGEARFSCQQHGPCERTVSSNDHQCIHFILEQRLVRLSAALLGSKCFTTSRLQDGAASTEDLGDRTHMQPLEVAINQSLIPLENTHRLTSMVNCCPHHCANSSIHSR